MSKLVRSLWLSWQFKKNGPWVTRFEIDGKVYGGDYDPYDDPRMDWLFEEFPDAETILDLGSLEGAQSFRIAERSTVKSVLGLEVRPANIRRANIVRQLIGADKVAFAQTNLETADLCEYGRFDAVFCVGVLYHLENPWRLLKQISQVTDNVLIWTHYAREDQIDTKVGEYQGTMYQEFGWEDRQSGVAPTSFWPDFESLMAMVKQSGLEVRRMIQNNPHCEPGGITAFSAVKR